MWTTPEVRVLSGPAGKGAILIAAHGLKDSSSWDDDVKRAEGGYSCLHSSFKIGPDSYIGFVEDSSRGFGLVLVE